MAKRILKIVPAIIVVGLFFCAKPILVRAYPLLGTDFILTVKAMEKTYEFCYPEIDEYKGELYLKNIEQVVDGIYYDTLKKPIDARVEICPENENPFTLKKETNGKCIDKEDLLYKIQTSLAKRQGLVKAKNMVLAPEITIEKLQKSTYRRALFQTAYPYSSKERKNNIRLCAEFIGGVMLMPYEEFSFNQRVGERTEERGFQSAKVIENGKFIDGIGGGVCQVSSTVYNAVLLAGLKVTERHNHSMLVSYVEPSFDAMVSYGYADLRFINDTGGIVFLIANVKDDNIFISIYGEKTVYSYKRVSIVKEEIAYGETERVFRAEIPKGEEKFLVYPKNGAISEGYLEKYLNGVLISSSKLSLDNYKALNGVVIYNKSEPIS